MKLTAAIVLLAIIILLGYDAWTMCAHGAESTISWVVLAASHNYPVIPFLSGILCGHLFFSQRGA